MLYEKVENTFYRRYSRTRDAFTKRRQYASTTDKLGVYTNIYMNYFTTIPGDPIDPFTDYWSNDASFPEVTSDIWSLTYLKPHNKIAGISDDLLGYGKIVVFDADGNFYGLVTPKLLG